MYIPRLTLLGIQFGPEEFIPMFYNVIVVAFVPSAVLLWRIGRSPFGMALRAIRDNDLRAASIGVPVRRYRLVRLHPLGHLRRPCRRALRPAEPPDHARTAALAVFGEAGPGHGAGRPPALPGADIRRHRLRRPGGRRVDLDAVLQHGHGRNAHRRRLRLPKRTCRGGEGPCGQDAKTEKGLTTRKLRLARFVTSATPGHRPSSA